MVKILSDLSGSNEKEWFITSALGDVPLGRVPERPKSGRPLRARSVCWKHCAQNVINFFTFLQHPKITNLIRDDTKLVNEIAFR
jgi:hypothetical protein